jgi:hypothetical protein
MDYNQKPNELHQQGKVIAATYMHGCTAVVAVGGKGAYIGHFSEICGDLVSLEHEDTIKREVFAKLNTDLPLPDIDDTAKIYIIDSFRNDSGFRKIKEYLMGEGYNDFAPRIFYQGSSADGAPNSPYGKLLVKFEPDVVNGGGTTEVYWYSDNPIARHRSNKEGQLC